MLIAMQQNVIWHTALPMPPGTHGVQQKRKCLWRRSTLLTSVSMSMLHGVHMVCRKMSASQQAAAIPMEALKFSASFSDKLTGGARSLPSQSKAGNAVVVDADDEGDAGPLVSSWNGHSSGLTEVPPYDPVVIHRTEPWRRALVNDEGFDLKSMVFFVFRPPSLKVACAHAARRRSCARGCGRDAKTKMTSRLLLSVCVYLSL